MVERKIGEIFRCEFGKMVMCVEAQHDQCVGCAYAGTWACSYDHMLGPCSPIVRDDNKSVIFIDVGEGHIEIDIAVLSRLADEYPNQTLENVTTCLKVKLSELAR